MNFEDRPSSGGRFFEIAEALCRAVGNAIRPGFIDAVLAMLVVRRIQRVRGMLLALEARFLAGRLRRGGVRVVVPGVGEGAEDPANGEVAAVRTVPVPVVGFPCGFGWLNPLVPSYAPTYAGYFRVILAEPGMQALLAACPQAVRAVRPLCVMLGIERSAYVPPEVLAVEAARAEGRVRKPRKRRARVAFDYAAEDAHYASSQVPRRFRLRVF